MKTIITNLSSITATATKQCLMTVLAMLVCIGVMRADIVNPVVTTTEGYLLNGTSDVTVQLIFESNTFEYADAVSFAVNSPAAGITLTHGSPSPSPYIGCGLNQGDELAGPAWARTNFAAGGSACGAFETDVLIDFGLNITADATVTGPIVIDVTLTGDGFGNNGVPSVETVQVVIQPIMCEITCPDDITMVAEPGMCGAMVNIPLPTVTGTCTPNPVDMSGFYEVGTTEVLFVANSGGALETVCSMFVTVEDTQPPVLVNCDNISVALEAGQCDALVLAPFATSDNCEDLALTLSQNGGNEEIQDAVACPGGASSFSRIFDVAASGARTDISVESVTIGVFESFNDAEIIVNLYRYSGSLAQADLELVATNSQVLPNQTSYNAIVPIAADFANDESFVVEVATQTGLVSGFNMGFNLGSQTAPTYFKSDFCGIEERTNMSTLFTGYGALISINATQEAFLVEQTDNTGFAIDENFPPGVYNLSFDITDASGNVTQCAFTVDVQEYISSTGSIACNDAVNVSLDDQCSVVVTADMILEGGDYACYDDYTVSIAMQNGTIIGNTVGADQIGMTLNATVTDPNGNSCWGELIVEDKFGPDLDCIDIYTTCTGTTEPGDAVSDMVTFAGDVTGVIIDDVAPSVTDIDVEVFGLNGAAVTDINIVIDVDHSFPSDLIATIKAPNGDEVTLFSGPSGLCPEQGIRVTLDDEAMNTAADLANADACVAGATPAIAGAYQPAAPLSEFDGIDPNGTWTVTLADLFNGDGGAVNAISIVVSQQGATVAFPTTNPDITFQQTDNQVYSVTGIDLCGPVTLGYNDKLIEQDCSSEFADMIERTWTGFDASGNEAISCVQNIFVYRNDLSTLTFPPNFDGVQANTLECNGNYATDDNGNPALSVTGQPTGDFCDNVQIFPYEDTRVDVCPMSYKIVRKFKLLEWCSSQVIEHTQIIKIEDSNAPNIPAIDDLTISANAEMCEADIAISKPDITGECTPTEDLEFELAWALATAAGAPDPNAFYVTDNITELFDGKMLVRGLPAGRVWLRWTVADLCGNIASEYFTITVSDQVAPFAICDEFTVVGLSGDGRAIVDAKTFDDGSFDNCGDIFSYRARKMTNACGGSNAFAESVTFCCEERGQEVMVEFQVTDQQGLSNTCMVTVTVEDKLPPFITMCPADITLDCQSAYDPSVTGYIEFVDNCEIVEDGFEDTILSENSCGEKTIRRVFTIVDGEGLKNTCAQTITLETDDNDKFGINDIQWANDVEEQGCLDDIDPDNAPGPILNDGSCSQVAAYSEDQVFTLAGACVKILRKWTVIDWCQYNENNPVLGQGWWEDTQVIKLNNDVAPTFVSDCSDREICVFDEGCRGAVVLNANATDDCTPATQIAYSYEVDEDNDGDVDFTGSTTQYSRNMQEGTHSITWTAEDGCGNFSKCSYLFTVVDCKKPTPYCITSLTTVVMPSTGMITIDAEDYDFGSFDNCTPTDDLRYSFSANVNDDTRTFTCADIPNGESADIELRMYVTDKDGNQDYCTIEIVLQEGAEDQCDEGGMIVQISGQLRTEDYESIDEALVVMSSNAPEVDGQMMTDQTGNYVFSNLPIGYDYEIHAEKNGDYTNGVSTLDLVLIQRHLLGFDEFESPYKVIASDIDNNQNISAGDIVALRKLVLGITPEYPNGQSSWRFVDARQNFADITNPWIVDEDVSIDNINAHKTQMDLVAVKIGDVNSSATYNVNGTQSTETRSSKTITFLTDAVHIVKGEQIQVPIYAKDFENILGYQFTIEFDTDNLNFNGYEMGSLIVSDKHFALNRLDQGMITTSYSDIEPITVADDEPLFYLSFTAHAASHIGNVIDFTSRVTDAEVYDENYTVHGVELSLRGSDNEILSEGLTVQQNRPNPFRNTTDILFSIDGDSPVTLTVMDMAGKVLRKVTNEYTKGSHTITLDTESIAASGVLYYKIDADQGSVVRKMIKIK